MGQTIIFARIQTLISLTTIQVMVSTLDRTWLGDMVRGMLLFKAGSMKSRIFSLAPDPRMVKLSGITPRYTFSVQ